MTTLQSFLSCSDNHLITANDRSAARYDYALSYTSFSVSLTRRPPRKACR